MGAIKSIHLPAKAAELERPARYKILYGGRGSAKSWTVARILATKAASQKLRILCCREYQNSIAESSKHLIESQIALLGYDGAFRINSQSIVGTVTGSEFLFEGLHSNVNSIKSLEDIDICWIEQAETITKASLDVLIPTIRAEDSEIWLTINPELEIDEVYQRYILNPPKDSVVINLNYSDNEWLPKVLEKERLDCLERDPIGYRHIWLGECRQAIEGAIYGDLIHKAKDEGRITSVPYDLAMPVHTGWDLGVLDPTAIWFFQVTRGGEIHFIDYYEDSPAQQGGVSETGLPYHARMLKAKPYVYGNHYAPHDIEARELGTGKSRKETGLALGIRFTPVRRIAGKESREDEAGIAAVRDAFSRCWFDAAKTAQGIQMLSRYRRGFNKTLAEFTAIPVHDAASHCADAMRCAIVGYRAPAIIKERERMPLGIGGAQAWMS